MSVYHVKPIKDDDAGQLIEVWRETWISTYTASLGAAVVADMLRDLNENGVASLLPAEGSRGVCLLHGVEIVGTAIHSEGSVVYLWGMYVRPMHQRAGGGTLLLQSVRHFAGDRPIEVRVLRSSIPALSFYARHGFRTVGEETSEIMPGIEQVCSVMRWSSV